MGDYFRILRFGWPYLRRYWLRFALGVLFGFIFGFSNGLLLGAVNLMLVRLNPAPATVITPAAAAAKAQKLAKESDFKKHARALGKEVGGEIYTVIDPWLPVVNRKLDWKQVLGGLLLFPLVAGLRGLMSYATAYLMAWSSQRIVNDVKVDIFKKINSLSIDYFHRTTTAELMSRA